MRDNKISDFKFRDYNVRVWDDDVFINAYKDISYVDCAGAEGLQINIDDEVIYEQALNLCRKIGGYFLLLDALLDDIDAIIEEDERMAHEAEN